MRMIVDGVTVPASSEPVEWSVVGVAVDSPEPVVGEAGCVSVSEDPGER